MTRLTVLLVWTLLFMPNYALIRRFLHRPPLNRLLARFYWRTCARILGFRLIVVGSPSTVQPTLFVANHVSYFDIIILGGLILGSFVAKQEVRNWPGIGWMAKTGGTVFIDRKRHKSGAQREAIEARLGDEAESLILFPEGTSSDGNRVLPFKSALFAVATTRPTNGQALTIQPVSITYTRLDGMPIGRFWRPYFAWYGDMELAPHIWMAAGLGRPTVQVEFHTPVKIDMFDSRKVLAEHCHAIVRAGVIAANVGRDAVRLAPSTVS